MMLLLGANSVLLRLKKTISVVDGNKRWEVRLIHTTLHIWPASFPVCPSFSEYIYTAKQTNEYWFRIHYQCIILRFDNSTVCKII